MLVLNLAISYWNARSCGSYLTESKLMGGWTRFLVLCGLVMSALGFTWVYLTIITMATLAFGILTPTQAQIMFELGYLIIIFPLLGSGLGIWIHSMVVAFRTRKFGDIAVAGWNTYAMANNVWTATSETPDILKSVTGFFKGIDDDDSAAAILIILLVIVALAGGVITMLGIARKADREVAIDVVAR